MDDLLYISELIRKSWSDKLTETEKKYLDTWISKSEANRRLFEAGKERLERDLLNLEQYDIESATKRIFARVENNTENVASLPGITNRKKLWWMAAASAIFIVAFGIWVFRPSQVEPQAKHTPSQIEQDSLKIIPGGNNAVLTLSDGSLIILDSAADGLISNQGTAKVIKLESGKLAYNTVSSGKAASPVYNTISTPRGGQYQVTLPDGTVVWLNSASSVSFPTVFDETARQIKITGEVYLEVAPLINNSNQAKIPFVVKIASSSGTHVGEVQVLGTHFNINAYDDEGAVRTTLLEGAVKCINGSNNMILRPGQQANFSGSRISVKNDIDTDRVIAWKNGTFLFDSEDIESIMRQISRWYDIKVSYKGVISKEAFSGIVSRSSDLEQVLKIMEAGGVKFSIEGRKIIVMQ